MPVQTDPPSPLMKKGKTPIIVGAIAVVLVVIAAAVVLSGGLGNGGDPNPTNTPLWEANEDSFFKYDISGSYNNIYDPDAPRVISGDMKTTITSCTSTTFSTKSTGSVKIKGLDSDPIDSSGTSNRSDYHITSGVKSTISTKWGQKECYVITTKTTSLLYNDVTVTTYRGVSDGVMYKRVLDQKAVTEGTTVMSSYVTYTLTSYKIVK